jgi:transposase
VPLPPVRAAPRLPDGPAPWFPQLVAERFIEHVPMGLADRHKDNGESKVTDAYGMELLRLIEGSPQEHGYRRPIWTQELLILVLAERTSVRVSVTTMCRLLRQLGIRLNRPKPTVNCPWPKSRRQRRLRALKRLVGTVPRGGVVLYLDEVDIHLDPKVGPEWTLAGKQKYVDAPGCNQKRYLAGAFSRKTGKLTWVEGDRKNSLLFLNLLYKLVTETYRSTRRVHLILDNYGIHDSQQVRLALKSAAASKVKLHFLPPYCPDHNRIERIWNDVRDNVTCNHRCAGMEELVAEVRLYLNARNRHGRYNYARQSAA